MHNQSDHPSRRLRWLLIGFSLACAGIWGRLAAFEIDEAAEYRAESLRPVEHARVLPAIRGRILARDGSVLACDEPVESLAVQYRYLEEPPNPNWLRRQARSRLSARERKQPQRVVEEVERVVAERAEMQRRLAELCGLSPMEWQARCEAIETRVGELSDRVNHRHRESATARGPTSDESASDSWFTSAGRRLFDGLFRTADEPPAAIIVADELREQVVFSGLSLAAIAEIEGHPEQFPGVKVLHESRRVYPGGPAAAHLVGYVSCDSASGAAAATSARSGLAGIERQFDALLRGRDGSVIDRADHRGKSLGATVERPPVSGRDVVLSFDPGLQSAAETLLDAALARRVSLADDREQRASGGAIVVLDVNTGAVLAAASAPRFNPTSFAEHDSANVRDYLDDPGHPLFDRTIQMALPPGSVFKTLTAVALMHTAGFDPEKPFDCVGYLHTPDRERCLIYRHTGEGHGPVALADALAQSCNVYFFHQAEEFGPAPLVDWGRRFGFGQRTGIDLPGEATGHLPAFNDATAGHHRSQSAEVLPLAIGQGSLTATPLQIARMMAAVANGGQLVTPHIVERLGLPTSEAAATDDPEINVRLPQPIPGLDPQRLKIVREGLRRVVADVHGTGHATVALDGIEIAGKTGTAEAGNGQADHAWFAGYAPAETPRIAFVVVLEHAGTASATAGPVAKRLVEKAQSLGYFTPGPAVRRN